jgi:hypothetical protein
LLAEFDTELLALLATDPFPLLLEFTSFCTPFLCLEGEAGWATEGAVPLVFVDDDDVEEEAEDDGGGLLAPHALQVMSASVLCRVQTLHDQTFTSPTSIGVSILSPL